MKGKLKLVFFLLLANFASLAADSSSPTQEKAPMFKSQIGLAFEENPNRCNLYLFWNQLINSHWYYELRAYGNRNWIVNNPPNPVSGIPEPHPIVKDERNKWGWGGIAIGGYVFDFCQKLSLMPFIRLEARSNNAFCYRDKFHNAVQNRNYAYLLGLKLTMKVNDAFSIYAQYYGGYFRNDFKGKRYFSETPPSVVPANPTLKGRKHVHANGLLGVFEFGFPYTYKCNECWPNDAWVFTPYIQFVVNDNNISYINTVKPYSLNPLTQSFVVWAIRIAKQF